MMEKKGAKGLAEIIIAKGKPRDEESDESESESGEGFESAAKEMFAAMQDEDESKFMRALKNAVRLCDE